MTLADPQRQKPDRWRCRPGLRRPRRAATVSLALACALFAGVPGGTGRAEFSPSFVVALVTDRDARDPNTGAVLMRRAAEEAVAALSANGGLVGRQIRLSVFADACSASGAMRVAAAVVAEKPDLVVGHPCSPAAIAAAKVYAAAGVLFIAAAPRHPDLTVKRAGPTIFRLAGRDDLLGQSAAQYVLALQPARRVAIVHDRTSWARELAGGFKARLVAAGHPPTTEIGIVASNKDYSTVVRAIADARVDIVFLACFSTEAAVVMSQMKALGLTPEFVGPDGDGVSGEALTLGVRYAGLSQLETLGAATLSSTELTSAGSSPSGSTPAMTETAQSPARAVRLAIGAWAHAVEKVASSQQSAAPYSANGKLTGTSPEPVARRWAKAMTIPADGTLPSGSEKTPVIFGRSGDALVPSFVVTRMTRPGLSEVDAVIAPFVPLPAPQSLPITPGLGSSLERGVENRVVSPVGSQKALNGAAKPAAASPVLKPARTRREKTSAARQGRTKN